MKKAVAVVLALVMLFALFAGCGKKGSKSGGAAIVEIWHTYTGAQQEYLEKAAADFNASQKDYEVKVVSQAYSGFADTVYNAVANGTGPSIIFNYASTAVDYIEEGLAVNIAQYIDDDVKAGDTAMQDIIDSLPVAMKTDVMGFSDGGIYYLPGCTTGPVFFYNKTMYDALKLTAPKSWAELADNCQKIYEEYGIAGYLADGLTDDIQALIMQSGLGYIDTANKSVLFDDAKLTSIFDDYATCVNSGYFALTPTNDYASDDFNTELIAGFSGSCVNDQYISSDKFEIAVSPWLSGSSDSIYNTPFYTAWNRGPIFLKQSDDANKGAYEFIKYFLSAEVNAGWAEVNSAISPYGTTEDNADYQAYLADAPEALLAVQANLEYAGSFPNVPGASEIRSLLVEYLTYCVSGEMTAEKAVEGLVAACNEALAG